MNLNKEFQSKKNKWVKGKFKWPKLKIDLIVKLHIIKGKKD